MNADEVRTILDELKELDQKDAYDLADLRRATNLESRARHERDKVAMSKQLASLGTVGEVATQQPGTYHRGDVASALLDAGFHRKNRPAVVIENAIVLETKSGSFDGSIGDAVPSRFTGAPLGADERYLYPRLRTENVPGDATSVATYRQKSRTLADPAQMVKAIDSTDPKEETDTVAEAFPAELKMIANVSSGTPNILLASSAFVGWVNNDLVTAYRLAVDTHIVGEIDAASIPAGGGGANAFEDVLYTREVVRAAGYSPDLVVVSPADALAIRLLQMTGGDSYAFAQQLPTFVVTNAVDDGAGFVMDSQSLGTLFLGPFVFQAFEENNGTTNTSTVRAESSGRFVVQRSDAAATLSAGS